MSYENMSYHINIIRNHASDSKARTNLTKLQRYADIPFTIPQTPTICNYLAANRLLALNLSPKKYNTYTPALHPMVNPANSVTPLSTPRLWNMG
jgi:hypothetical protein